MSTTWIKIIKIIFLFQKIVYNKKKKYLNCVILLGNTTDVAGWSDWFDHIEKDLIGLAGYKNN